MGIMAQPCYPSDNPFLDWINSLKKSSSDSSIPTESTCTNPFLHEFLAVYEGDWIFVPNSSGDFYSVDISKGEIACNEDKTECCGLLETRPLGANETTAEFLFCLSSTYEISLRDKDKTSVIPCIGVRGSRVENPLHPCLNLAIDNPTHIHCGIFSLVRPE
jgi:hypothetical protein